MGSNNLPSIKFNLNQNLIFFFSGYGNGHGGEENSNEYPEIQNGGFLPTFYLLYIIVFI